MKKKIGKKILLTLLCLVLIVSAVTAGFVVDAYVTMPPYSEKKLNFLNYSLTVFDKDEKPVDFSLADSGACYAEIETLSEHTKKAFILAEDKKFYEHGGVDYRRIAGAALNNIFHSDSLQGASTITQQLVKNTHLDSSRTIRRKIQEMHLAGELEKNHTKDEILEMYLNTIYFGNRAFGIEKAAKIYFDKPASELTPAESATLAAVIKGPSVYAPNVNMEKCLGRRDYILKLLFENAVITESEYNEAINTKIDLNKISEENVYKNAYCDAAISEAAELLGTTQNEIYGAGLKIFTYMDSELQQTAENLVYSEKYTAKNNAGKTADSAVIILDNKTAAVSAFAGRSTENLYNMKRQPGSCIKPSLVYVPALEENLITPLSFLYDAKVSYGDYSPDNYKDKYYGWITAERAMEMSLNSPAVALFNMTGIEKSKDIAAKSGISFHENDSRLALSLGGFTYGTTIKELAGSYMTLANEGTFSKSGFIKKIVSAEGKILYSDTKYTSSAMRKDTAFLMSQILTGVAENGTATHLKGFKYDVAAKTGTVGTENSDENTDAWLMSYTSKHTVGVWYGAPKGKDYLLEKKLTGGSIPAELAAEIYGCLYKNNRPDDFKQPDTVKSADVDILSLEKYKVELAAPNTPERYKKKAYFSVFNMPSRVADSPYNLVPALKSAG